MPKRTHYPKGKQAKSESGPVTSIKPDPGVWKEALKAAGGDRNRLQQNTDGSVTIWNSAEQAKRMRG